MIGVLADGTVHRIITKNNASVFEPDWKGSDLLGSIEIALSACLDSTGQFLTSSDLNQNKLPPVVQYLLDMLRNIDDSVRRNDLVVSMDIPIE